MSTFDEVRALLDARDAERERLRADVDAGQIALRAQVQLTVEAERKIADLQAQIAAHVCEPAPVQRTVFGASPTTGRRGDDVVAKWGAGCGVRLFFPGGFEPVARPEGAGVVHVSWKPELHRSLSTIAILAAVASLRAGDVVEVWHELDVKARNGSLADSQVRAAFDRKAELHRIIKAERPDLLTATTYSAWHFQSNGAAKEAGLRGPGGYTSVAADLIGVDFDGNTNLKRYPSFDGCIDAITAYVTDHGYQGWSVPEFIHPRLDGRNGETPIDRDGTQRAAWAAEWAGKFSDAGAYAVHLFDFDHRPGQIFQTGSPEHAAWAPLIG